MIEDPGIPPAVPTGLRVFYASDGEIVIEWRGNSEPDVKGYNIYRRTDSTESVQVAYVKDDFFFDDSLSYDTTYYYKITAVNLWDRESDFSAEISAKPENRYNPLRPIGLRINARNWEGEVSVFLNWLKGEESDIEGYNIYRDIVPGFTPDNSNLIGFSPTANFSDTTSLNFYQNYFYKILAKDKGGLLSSPSDEVNDLILEIPEVIFPPDNATVEFFEEFIIEAIDIPATYRIGLQTNKFFGEIWSRTVSTSITNDTIKIIFDPPALQVNKVYYWRIATYSGNSSDPNSISKIFSVIFRD
jgi:fibronectin type 3 domain-containing protein